MTYSIKYRDYMRTIRERQINRAEKLINANSDKLRKASATDCKRFINQINCTKSGEIAEKSTYSLDYEAIENESKYDGFYGVCTNIQDETCEIIKINKNTGK